MDKVEVVFVPFEKPPLRLKVTWFLGMTVGDVIERSGMVHHYPEAATMSVGVFSKRVSHKTHVCAGDRVEIYRPLLRDPKETRRVRAKKKL